MIMSALFICVKLQVGFAGQCQVLNEPHPAMDCLSCQSCHFLTGNMRIYFVQHCVGTEKKKKSTKGHSNLKNKRIPELIC